MAITNHERVGKALELLKAGLGPFVERELKARYGDGWAFEAKEVLSDTRLGAGKDDSLHDVAALLVIMDRKRKLVGHVGFEKQRLLPGEDRSVALKYGGELKPGDYDAILTVDYGEAGATVKSTTFTVAGGTKI